MINSSYLNGKLLRLLLLFLFSSFTLLASINNQLSECCAQNQFLIEGENSTWRQATNNFSIIVLPDTQYYSYRYPHIFANQTQWIVDNAQALNVVFVPHLGDLVQNGNLFSQWEVAVGSMSILDLGRISWAVLPGNHEFWGDRDLTNYNAFFGVGNFSGRSWFGGAYPVDTNNNNYALFSGGGNDYLIFSFQYHLSDSVLVWANETIAQYPDRRVIVAAHEYLGLTGERSREGDRIWYSFVEPHANQVFLVLSGHFHGESHRTDYVGGYVVHQLLCNFQSRPNGGNGWLRILEFNPENDNIVVKTFSPYLNSYENDGDSYFSLEYKQTEEQQLPLFGIGLTISFIAAVFIGLRFGKTISKFKFGSSVLSYLRTLLHV